MPETLNTILKDIEKVQLTSLKNHVEYNHGLWNRVGKKAIENVLENDELARDAALGRRSAEPGAYQEAISYIVERYSSIRSRVFKPKKDTLFDEHVEEVVGSVNSIGATDYIDPASFTTEGIRETQRRQRNFGIGMSVTFGVLTGLAAILEPSITPEETYNLGQSTALFGVVSTLASGVALGFAKCLFSMNNNEKIKENIGKLQDGAMSSARYLRNVTSVYGIGKPQRSGPLILI